MPLPNLPVPTFPNVPAVPGVPPVLRGPPNINLPTPAPLSGDGGGLASTTQAAKWGLYDSGGSPVVVADSVVGFDFLAEYRISDFPIEGGLFASYNKVKVPYDARLTFSKGGTEQDRTTFLNAIQAALEALDLYTVVTPEVSYANANVTHYDYRRTSTNGATLLTVDVWTQEVRVSAAPQYTQTTAPSGADPVNGGAVQPQDPTSAQASQAQAALDAGPPDGG
jgi:hypothetical protein